MNLVRPKSIRYFKLIWDENLISNLHYLVRTEEWVRGNGIVINEKCVVIDII